MVLSQNPVKAVRVVLHCDQCGGRMSHTGVVFTRYPPLYPHKCDKCGYEEKRDKIYPAIEYENEEEI
jgi:hypothetical protein